MDVIIATNAWFQAAYRTQTLWWEIGEGRTGMYALWYTGEEVALFVLEFKESSSIP